jgi:hypothetical protein
MRSIHRRKRPLGAVFVLALTLATAAPSLARLPGPQTPGKPGYHGCGLLVVNSRPWKNFVDGHEDFWSTSWIVWWESHPGRRSGNCAFAKSQARAAISGVPQRDVGKALFSWHGGTCNAQGARGHEVVTPFHEIRCSLTLHAHRKAYRTLIGAMGDPDPTHGHIVGG